MVINIEYLNLKDKQATYGISIVIDKVRDSHDKSIVNLLTEAIQKNSKDASILGAGKSLNKTTFACIISIYFSSALSMHIFASYLKVLLSRYGAIVVISKDIIQLAYIELIKLGVYTDKTTLDLDKVMENGCLSYRVWLNGHIFASSSSIDDMLELAFTIHESKTIQT